MRKIYSVSVKTIFLVLLSLPSFAQNIFFKEVSERNINTDESKRTIRPQQFKTFQSDNTAIESFLNTISLSPSDGFIKTNAPIIQLPMPDGSMAAFRIWQTEVMAPGLAAKYPMIKTFAGEGVDDKFATIQLDYNPYAGLRAQILSANGNVYIDPYSKDKADYSISYYRENYSKDISFQCNTNDTNTPILQMRELAGFCMGTQLYTFRLALAATGEYSNYFLNGSETTDVQRRAKVLAAMVTSVNRVNGIYEKEISVHLTLINRTDELIYLDGTSDPYTNNNGNTMLTENQATIDAIIGTSNYDIGHVFSTGGGGIAVVGGPCGPNKAKGVTGSSAPTGDAYDVDYVAHEIGHQLGARHSFNSVTDNCGGGNRSSATAYEPGSGTTIMGYAGICGTDNIQPNSDPYFHSASIDEITTFLQTASCAQVSSTGNAIPQITAMNNNGVKIPLQTPFTLTATATDPNGDPLTYDWEEWDLGDAGNWDNGAFSTTAPLFKSRIPKTSGSRTFPDMSVILAGYPATPSATMNGLKGETLPGIARTIKFRLTVRDNKGGVVTGGNGCQPGFDGTFQVSTVAATGPFKVTNPNAPGLTVIGGALYTITWNVAGTNANGINCTDVKISLSIDGGLTYPTVLTTSTPNDGSESLLIPNVTTATARIKIEAIGNIFFDISDNNFSINSSLPTCPSVTKQPDNISACATINTASFSVAGSGTDVLYQWEVSTNGGVSYTDIPGATAAVYTTGILTDAMNGNRYRAKVYTATCTVPTISNAALLTVLVRPSITLTATSTALLPGQVSVLTATANPAAGVIYTWYKDGVVLNGVTGTSYTVDVTSLGSYQVKITNADNCTNESAVVTVSASPSSRLFIYPNPNNGQFTVSYYNSLGTTTQQIITIYDAHGAKVYNQKLAVSGPYQLHPINLKAVARGVYLVVIGDINGKRLAEGKVLIQY